MRMLDRGFLAFPHSRPFLDKHAVVSVRSSNSAISDTVATNGGTDGTGSWSVLAISFCGTRHSESFEPNCDDKLHVF